LEPQLTQFRDAGPRPPLGTAGAFGEVYGTYDAREAGPTKLAADVRNSDPHDVIRAEHHMACALVGRRHAGPTVLPFRSRFRVRS